MSDALLIRLAKPADTSALATLERDIFGTDAWSPALLAGVVSRPRSRGAVLIATDEAGASGEGAAGEAMTGEAMNRELVGYTVISVAGDVADLERIAVVPEQAGRGVGSTLLAAVIDAAEIRGCDRLLLEVRADDARARGFYERYGFEVIESRPRYYRDGTAALVMRRHVAADRSGRPVPSEQP